MVVTRSRLAKYLTTVVVLAPLFLQYVFLLEFVLLPEVFLVIGIAAALLLSPTIEYHHHQWMMAYLAYALVVTIVTSLFGADVNLWLATTTFARFTLYVLAVMVIAPRYFDITYGFRLLIAIASLNCAYGLVQYVAYHTRGLVLPWTVPFLDVRYGQLLIEEHDYFFETFGYRFSGMFSEPAHLSQYVGIALIVLLFSPKSNIGKWWQYRYVLSALMVSSIGLSGSGTGVFVVGFISAALIVASVTRAGSTRKRLVVLGVSAVVAGLAVTYWTTGGPLSAGVRRVTSIGEAASIYVRVIRPIQVYVDLPDREKLLGVGFGNYAQVLRTRGLLNIFEEERDVAWTNTVGYVLVGTGMFGLVLFLGHFLVLWTRSGLFGRTLVSYTLAHLVFSDLALSLYYVLVVSVVVALSYRAKWALEPLAGQEPVRPGQLRAHNERRRLV